MLSYRFIDGFEVTIFCSSYVYHFWLATVHVFNTWILTLPNTHPRTGHKTWQFLISCVCIQFLLIVMWSIYFALHVHINFGVATVHVFNTWFLILPNTHPHTGHKTWQFLISCAGIQTSLTNVLLLQLTMAFRHLQ